MQLKINPDMDLIAKENGIEHWSCVSPLSNRMWVRSDGIDFFSVYGDNWVTSLKEVDKVKPIGEDWQTPRYDLIERRRELLLSGKPNKKELELIDEKLSRYYQPMQFTTVEDEKAMNIIRKAAKLLDKENSNEK